MEAMLENLEWFRQYGRHLKSGVLPEVAAKWARGDVKRKKADGVLGNWIDDARRGQEMREAWDRKNRKAKTA